MGIPWQSTVTTRIEVAGEEVGGALGVEGIEILCSVLEGLFEAAQGDGQPAGVQNPIDGLAQRTLSGSVDQALLEFLGTSERVTAKPRPVGEGFAGPGGYRPSGRLLERMVRCDKPQCACGQDRPTTWPLL
jgi:hypothetical protein